MIYLHIFGASSRISELYLPTFIKLKTKHNFQIKNIYNRTLAKAAILKEKICEGEITDNLDIIQPVMNGKNIAIVSISNTQNFKFTKLLLERNFNVFIDTPISRKVYQAKDLKKIARKNNLLLCSGEEKAFTDEIKKCKEFISQENSKCCVVNESYGSSYHAFSIAAELDSSIDNHNLVSFKGNIFKTKFTTEYTEIYNFSSGFQYIIKDFLPSRHPIRSVGRLTGINQNKFITFSDANIGPRNDPKLFSQTENTKRNKLEGLLKNMDSFMEAIEKENHSIAIYGINESIRDLSFSKFQTLSRKSKYLIHHKIIIFIVNMLCFFKLM